MGKMPEAQNFLIPPRKYNILIFEEEYALADCEVSKERPLKMAELE